MIAILTLNICVNNILLPIQVLSATIDILLENHIVTIPSPIQILNLFPKEFKDIIDLLPSTAMPSTDIYHKTILNFLELSCSPIFPHLNDAFILSLTLWAAEQPNNNNNNNNNNTTTTPTSTPSSTPLSSNKNKTKSKTRSSKKQDDTDVTNQDSSNRDTDNNNNNSSSSSSSSSGINNYENDIKAYIFQLLEVYTEHPSKILSFSNNPSNQYSRQDCTIFYLLTFLLAISYNYIDYNSTYYLIIYIVT